MSVEDLPNIGPSLPILSDDLMGIAEKKLKNVTPDDEVNWRVVQLIVERFTEKYPEEVMGAAEYVKMLKNDAKDKKFGTTDGDASTRHLMELPNRLEYGLSLKYPQIFKGKNLKTFFKLYPIFFIPEKL
jgi:hypothetical protein